MEPKIAVGYIRWSTQDIGEGESPEIQVEAITNYCKTHDYTLSMIYKDESISGFTTKKRPAFRQMQADAEVGKFKFIIVFKLDRFGRNLKEILINSDDFEALDIQLIFLKENIDTTNYMGRAYRNLMGLFAELDRDSIKDRMGTGRYKKWKDNRTFIGRPPFGYSWDKESKTIDINPHDAAIYHKIVDWYLSGGSYKTIAEKLRAMEVRCKKAYFSSATIGTILRNPAYTGSYVVNKKVFDGKLKTKKDKPIEENITITLPQLISRVDYQKIQDRIQFNRVITKRTVHPEFWLRNVLQCAECRATIKPKLGGFRTKKGATLRYYGCYWNIASKRTLAAHGRNKCKLPYIRAEVLEDRVEYYLLNFLTFGGFSIKGVYHAPEIEALVAPERFDEQILALSSQLIHFKRTLGRKAVAKVSLFEMLEMESADKNLFLSQMARLTDEQQLLTSQIDEVQNKLTTLEKQRDNTDSLVSFVKGNTGWLKSLTEQILNLSFTDKQRLIESMLDGKIEVSLETDNGVDHWDINPKFTFNLSILQALSDEGKLDKVNPR
ncbi:recombinase family protein [bacterium]|nr:MAG: recombinase family protein [bacterium]